jgi:hypothetical protein
MLPEFSPLPPPPHAALRGQRACGLTGAGRLQLPVIAALCTLLLAGCTLPPQAHDGSPQASAPPSGAHPPVQAAPAGATYRQGQQAAPDPAPDPLAFAQRSTPALETVLNYADKIRTLPGSDIAREIGRLSPLAEQAGPEIQPLYQLQLALALAQTRNTLDLVRAIGLTQRVQEVRSPLTLALQPLARLLQQRYSEQRRAEELNDRLGLLLRDTQRRLDSAHDRLEALKAIERSLYNSRGSNNGSSSHSASP